MLVLMVCFCSELVRLKKKGLNLKSIQVESSAFVSHVFILGLDYRSIASEFCFKNGKFVFCY